MNAIRPIPDLHHASPDEVRTWQEARFLELLRYLANHSAFYRQHFERHGLRWKDIRGLEDLTRMPTTTKDDLQAHNWDFLCVEETDLADLATTSGTLGHPVIIGSTSRDLERLAQNERMAFELAGCASGDRFQLLTTMDRRFMAGLAYYLGVQALGGGIVRVGAGHPELQWDSIMRMKPRVLIAVPSFMLQLVEYARSRGFSPNDSSVELAICIGESIRNQDFTLNNLGQRLRSAWNIRFHSTYASTEMATAFTECEAGRGGHQLQSLILLEVLDDHGQPVPEGEVGEVTVTPLGVEGMPLLRFRTGDLCRLYRDPCACGRLSPRLGPVLGRKQQMIKYRGTTLYPPALYDLLKGVDGVANFVVEVRKNDIGLDEISFIIGCDQPDDPLKERLVAHIQSNLRVKPDIEFLPVKEVQRMQGLGKRRKPRLFVDYRSKK